MNLNVFTKELKHKYNISFNISFFILIVNFYAKYLKNNELNNVIEFDKFFFSRDVII